MKIKTKVVSLLLASIVGLLLGGNVFADGVSAQSASFEQVSAQIEQVRQKINQLSAELKAKQTAAPAPVSLTPEKLNYIEGEIKRIAKETERLEVEVAAFVALREIERKIAQISAEIAAISPLAGQSTIAAAPPAAMPTAPAPATAQTNEEIEAQIARIKQQINELTQEMTVQAAAEAGSNDAAGNGNDLEDQIETNGGGEEAAQEITILPNGEKAETAKTEQKGFWQSVGDFLKKIFTF